MRIKTLSIALIALAWFASACWWKQTPETRQQPKPIYIAASALGPGDLVEVKVYDEQDLSGIFRVASSGSITFPLLGRIQVEGMAAADVAEEIQKQLGEKYLRNPQVSILIKEYNSKKVSVFGEVSKPGTFKFEDGMSVIQAVSMAGGFTKMAAKDDTNVTRLIEGEEQKFPVPVEAIAQGKAKNFLLQPGDIVYVPESIW